MVWRCIAPSGVGDLVKILSDLIPNTVASDWQQLYLSP